VSQKPSLSDPEVQTDTKYIAVILSNNECARGEKREGTPSAHVNGEDGVLEAAAEVQGGEELEVEVLGGKELEAEGEIWDWKRIYRCGSSNTTPRCLEAQEKTEKSMCMV
jgi:hypothetical protein